MSAAVKVKHHPDEWFTRPAFSMLAAGFGFSDKSCCLKGTFDEGVAAGDVVMLL